GLADMVVTHDPEFVIPAVVQQGEKPSSLKTIPNLYFMHKGKIVHTRHYLSGQGHRPAFMMTARGCQYHCLFCDRNVLWGGGVRHRSVVNVLKEIKEL